MNSLKPCGFTPIMAAVCVCFGISFNFGFIWKSVVGQLRDILVTSVFYFVCERASTCDSLRDNESFRP
jgi:hypothetical protein